MIFPAYLIIDLMTFGGPLFISIIGKVKYLKNYKSFIPAIVIVAIHYIIWDMLVTGLDWHFNPLYVLSIRIVDLPLEEVMFFFVVPFAMLFVYEYIRYYVKEKTISERMAYYVFIPIFAISTVITIFSYDIQYLFLAMISVDILFLAEIITKFEMFRTRNYWIYMLMGLIAFLIVNYFLTSLPVVEYYHSKILSTSYWNGRITTIPLEDFIYNFALLSFYLFFYNIFNKKFISKN